MIFLPIDQVRLDFRSHLSALRWVGLLYRLPKMVDEAGSGLSIGQRSMVVLRIYLHALPYLFFFATLGRWSLFDISELGASQVPVPVYLWHSGFGFHALQMVFGLSLGLISALSANLAVGLVGGLAAGLVGGFAGGLTSGLGASSSVSGLILGSSFGLIFSLTSCLAGSLALGLAVGFANCCVLSLTGGLAGGLAGGFGYFLFFFRGYYFLVHLIWLWPYSRPSYFRLHPVAWDDVCLVPLPGLDRLLVSYAEIAPDAGEYEIDRLISESHPQYQAALRARAILITRRAAATASLSRLDEIFARFPASSEGFPIETLKLRQNIHEITTLQARIDTLDRPFLREPFTALLVKEIEAFEQRITVLRAPLSSEFRKAAQHWQAIAWREHEEARTATAREPTRQVFRAGDPVDSEREAFVPRAIILGELERQVMLATGCPGLLIYGRRRMGKSTLLRNMEGLLPGRVRVARLSMQEARAFTSLPDLIALIARRAEEALLNQGTISVAPHTADLPSDLKGFQTFLDVTDKGLAADDRRLLVAIDEYEYIDHKIGTGTFSEDLLAVIRESIQVHRRIIWAFAGSHSIDELAHAPWTSYLVSARTLEVTPFEPAETRLLLTEPLKYSSLWSSIESERPRFEPGFWGEGGIERIQAESGGWPHLVQLVAENVVDLVNDAGGVPVDEELLGRALNRSILRGNNVFLELLKEESLLPGEWDYIRGFRVVEEQPVPSSEALARSLCRRRLVFEEQGLYRLSIPLMSRWLRNRI